MKLPRRPPDFRELTSSLAPRLTKIFQRMDEWSRCDRYLHWNDLRRRPPPTGFTHQEWWLGLKFRRTSQSRPIALLDKRRAPFRFGVPYSLTELLHRIDRGLGAVLGLPDAIDHPETRDRYVIHSLIQESITSSQLEGAATTREVAREMLRSGRPPRDPSERMILNNYLTMRRIRDLRHIALTADLVFDLHRRVTDGTLDKADAAGRFRCEDENVRVEHAVDGTVYHLPPAADELPARLKSMCAFANGKEPDFFIHPVIRAIILHFWLAYDHPFVDGNGRTARALFYWSMLRHDYELFEYISISDILLRAPVRYAEAFLHTESDDNDLTYFILHQAGVIDEAVAALNDFLQRKRDELKAAENRLRGIQDLNHRQQALLVHALREPATRYLIRVHQRSHGVTHQTARDDLFDLVDRGLLTVHRQGRSYVFRIPQDLERKLGRLADAPPPAPADPTLPLDLPFRTKSD